MPRKQATNEEQGEPVHSIEDDVAETEIENLNRLLAAVLTYLSDDEVEEIDIEYLLTNTEGLRDWWEKYRESNRKLIEDEIKKSLGDLTLKELERIHEKIKEKE